MTRSPGFAGAPHAGLEDILACPRCKEALEFAVPNIRCSACGAVYPQSRDDCVDLLLPDRPIAGGPEWMARQEEMEAWYRDMVASDWARACFAQDYGPFAHILGEYRGSVLDLGGGAGVTRHYLRAHSRYVVVDPSIVWLSAAWSDLADQFPCLSSTPPFVRGTGEDLPFLAEAFDVVLAFWTLNHAADPERLLSEVARVLAPGGVFLAVLEDMEPRWRDFARPTFRRGGALHLVRSMAHKARAHLPGREWPVQNDHRRIRESDLQRWSAVGFDSSWRAWTGGYLTYEYTRRVRV